MPAGEKDRGAVSLLCELNTNLQSKSVRLAISLLTDRRLSAATHVNLLDRLLCLQNAVDFFCLFIFNWFMIAWQYWLDFCRTSARMNHGCTCVPSLLNLLLTSPPIPGPPGYHRTLSRKEPGSFTCVTFVSWNSPIPFSRLLDGLVALHPDFSETAFYLYLLFQWFFFFSRNFYQVWTQGSCSVF